MFVSQRGYALLFLLALGCAAPQTTDSPAPLDSEEGQPPVEKPALPEGEDAVLSNIRQLIYDGKRSGEGYFSADGKQLIFQSERAEHNPFYQIYLLDLETGESELVGPNLGKHTCAWVHPKGDSILYASTFEDPDAQAEMDAELAFRASGQTRRYSWDYDPYYEIYADPLGEGEPVNLTNTMGYDAEGSYSPDGSLIAFASNRRAFNGTMTEEEARGFEEDPAFMMDIYIMKADGTGVTQLTDVPGYDGGPFFSPDGQRITWRRFAPNGATAEIWTMNIDGSDAKQLTELKAMSWAPYYHPSGDYLIFATNLHGFGNFELYLVDAKGEREPVRVTHSDGWDGLPVFSPDGKKLAWSSGRTADKKAQVFMANWDDAAARQLLSLSGKRGEVAYLAAASGATADLSSTTSDITPEDARFIVDALTTPAMAGRLTGTEGEANATQWVAEAFKAYGLAPAGSEGYFQPFEFTSGVTMRGPNVLSIVDEGGDKTRPDLDDAWRPLAFSKAGSIGFADLAFVGYGIVLPEQPGVEPYNSYGDVDVTGKWAVALRYMPEDISPERRQEMARYASLRFKAMEARDRGAVGLIVVSGPNAQVKDQLVPLRFDASVAGTSIAAVSVSDALAQGWFEAAGKDLGDAQSALDSGETTEAFLLEGTQVGGHFTLKVETSVGRNTLGRLVVGDAPSAEIVVVGAHVDHLGRGEGGDSLAKGDDVGGIHHGADDNASGVAGLLEIAQYLAAQKEAGKLKDAKRDIVFAAWSGEELGLLGSHHFVTTYPAPEGDKSLHGAIAAYLNMDMIGRMDKAVAIQGVGSSPYWKPELERRNVPIGLPLTLSEDTYLPTDATSFYLKGVPILAAFTGAHGDYHTPSDTAEKLDYESLTSIAKLMGLITRSISLRDEAPTYVKVAPKATGSNRRVGRAYLGTIPAYAESDVVGVMFNGVSEGSPAQKGGVQGGDVMVELAGKPIGNIYDYVRILDALKIGDEVKMVVLRDGERLELVVTPSSRD